MGTVNLLESIRDVPSIKACLIMTSDKAYENKERNYAYRENDSMGGHDPYSASKGASELVISSYRRSFFNQKNSPGIATIRAGNVIGGGDWAKYRIIPDCIRSLSNNKKIILRNPQAVRPWQYVLESLSGLLLIGTKLVNNTKKYGEAWNVGPYTSNGVSVKSLVGKIVKKWGSGTISIKKQDLHEAQFLRLDSSKIFNMLKWEPTYSIKESIDETIDWYLRYNEDKRKMHDFTISQLEKYISKARQLNKIWTK